MVEQSIDEVVGANVRNLREALGLKQAEMASHVGDGFQQQTIVKIEKGARPLRLSEAVRIAQVLGVEVADLYASDAGRIQLLGIFQSVRELYDEARERIYTLEDMRLELILMAQKCEENGPLPADLRGAIDGWGREDLIDVCVEDARTSPLLRLKREAMGRE